MPSSLRFSIALVLSIVGLTTSACADLQAGTKAYDRGDYATALHEWRPLAEQGNRNAQFNLGVLYAKGLGEPQDLVQAHMWFNLSAAHGEMAGALQRDTLAKQMTPAQIDEAHKLAREWKPKQ